MRYVQSVAALLGSNLGSYVSFASNGCLSLVCLLMLEEALKV